MHSELIATLFGHSLLGATFAVLALATSFWLLLAFRSARLAITELSRLNRTLRASASPRLQGRAP
jgi:hypothetical protein